MAPFRSSSTSRIEENSVCLFRNWSQLPPQPIALLRGARFTRHAWLCFFHAFDRWPHSARVLLIEQTCIVDVMREVACLEDYVCLEDTDYKNMCSNFQAKHKAKQWDNQVGLVGLALLSLQSISRLQLVYQREIHLMISVSGKTAFLLGART